MNYKNLEKAAVIFDINNQTKKLVKYLCKETDGFDIGSLDVKDKIKQSISNAFEEIKKDFADQVKQF